VLEFNTTNTPTAEHENTFKVRERLNERFTTPTDVTLPIEST
jgi:hypothetical protein